MEILKRVFSFEGIEGCGKSSAIQGVKQHLELKGHRVEIYREPGSTQLGESVRNILLDKNLPKNPWSEFYLFLAARQELISTFIKPSLKSDSKLIILLDRYHDSSLAYQGGGRALGVDTLLKLIESSSLNCWPEGRFYLSISWDISLERQAKRGSDKDYFEQEEKSFFQKVIAGYEDILKRHSAHFLKIDASRSPEQIVEEISHKIESQL
ncbi:MAG: dTMP kinase [Bacteriovoracaceae bacterium]|nr:dTMP kinase [Bacteriovoracaceae bacterium]